MKLGDKKEFFVVRKSGTEEYYREPANTTADILEARRFTEREEVDAFRTEIDRAGIRIEQKTPLSEIIRIQITAIQR